MICIYCLGKTDTAVPGKPSISWLHMPCCIYGTTHAEVQVYVRNRARVSAMQTYMLKLARSGEDADKAFVVLESGTRFHTTVVS